MNDNILVVCRAIESLNSREIREAISHAKWLISEPDFLSENQKEAQQYTIYVLKLLLKIKDSIVKCREVENDRERS